MYIFVTAGKKSLRSRRAAQTSCSAQPPDGESARVSWFLSSAPFTARGDRYGNPGGEREFYFSTF